MTINERLVLSKLIDINEEHKKKYPQFNEPIVLNWDNFDEVNPIPDDLVYEDNAYIRPNNSDKLYKPEQIMCDEFIKNNLPKLINCPEDCIKLVYDNNGTILTVIQITYPLMINRYTKDRIDELLHTMGYVCSDNRMKSDNNIIQYKPIEY